METLLTKEDLINFEEDIALLFNNKQIKAPIHLYSDCEEQMLEIFKEINKDDYIFSSWRSHYQVLLKGVPKERLKQDILNGQSISLCYKDYKVFTSAILGQVLPISLGVSLDIKRKTQKNKVWCWLGDMTSCNGLFYESLNYAQNWDLPITYIIENNGKSVKTNTYEVMNTKKLPFEPEKGKEKEVIKISKHLYYYWYKMERWAHAGTNIRVQF